MKEHQTSSPNTIDYEFTDAGLPRMPPRKLTVSEWEKLESLHRRMGLPPLPRPKGLLEDPPPTQRS